MAWAPDEAVYNGIVGLLKQADSPDMHVQRRIAEGVAQAEAMVDAPCYYCFIMVDQPHEDVTVRQRAGLLLKSRILPLAKKGGGHRHQLDGTPQPSSLTPNELTVLEYVKSNILRSICDHHRVIRETAGSVLSTIFSAQGAERFPQALPALFQFLDHPSNEVVDGAFSALIKVVEDEVERNDFLTGSPPSESDGLTHTTSENPFLEFCNKSLLPRLISLATPHTPLPRRRQALVCLNHFERANLFAPGDVFYQWFDAYWHALGLLAFDSEVRLQVLQGMVHVAVIAPDVVLAKLESLVGFVLECISTDQTYEVKLEALDLALQIVKQPGSHNFLKGYLPQLLPLLVVNARYSDWDYLQMDQSQLEDDNAGVVDLAQDIQPRFHHRPGAGADDEFDDDEDQKEAKGVWGAGWTVRKSAAMLVDHLSSIYRADLLPHILPTIEEGLRSPNWEIRESGVLVLGATAHGCMEGLEPFLPNVLEMLLTMCDDPKPILRSISLWTIGRFGMWIAEREPILKAVAARILSHILDRNKRVQEAACSAFAVLEEEARDLLLPYLNDIIDTFGKALQTYQTKNLMVLFDALGVLTESLGQSVDFALFHEVLLEPLLRMWTTLDASHPALVVSFECLTCIVPSIPKGLPRYATGITQRCLELMRGALQNIDAYIAGESARPRREVVECSLDLLSALCGVLKRDAGLLLEGTDCIDLVEKCCCLSSSVVGPTVQQAAFALVGDMAEHVPYLVVPRIPKLVPQLTRHIAYGPASVCNNASWAIGQLALYGARHNELEPFIVGICEELIRVIRAPYAQTSLMRNACMTMGRLGRVSPALVATAMSSVFETWCRVMAEVPNDAEKVNAFHGLCHIINANRQLAVRNLAPLLDALCTLYYPPAAAASSSPPPPPVVPKDVDNLCRQMVSSLQASLPDEWRVALTELRPQTLQILQSWSS